jgi:hypothetical protein
MGKRISARIKELNKLQPDGGLFGIGNRAKAINEVFEKSGGTQLIGMLRGGGALGPAMLGAQAYEGLEATVVVRRIAG